MNTLGKVETLTLAISKTVLDMAMVLIDSKATS